MFLPSLTVRRLALGHSFQQVGSTFLRWRLVCKPISPSISVNRVAYSDQSLRCQLSNEFQATAFKRLRIARLASSRSVPRGGSRSNGAAPQLRASRIVRGHSQSGEACEEFQRDHTSLMSLAGRSTRTAARHDPIFSSHQKKMLPLPLSSIPDDIHRLAT